MGWCLEVKEMISDGSLYRENDTMFCQYKNCPHVILAKALPVRAKKLEEERKGRKRCHEKRLLLAHLTKSRLWACLNCASLDSHYLHFRDIRHQFAAGVISLEELAQSRLEFEKAIDEHYSHANKQCYLAAANGCDKFADIILASL